MEVFGWIVLLLMALASTAWLIIGLVVESAFSEISITAFYIIPVIFILWLWWLTFTLAPFTIAISA